MAACNLGGTSNIQFPKLDFTRSRSGNLRPLHGIRPRQNALPFTGLVLSTRSAVFLTVSCAPSAEIEIKTAGNLENELEGKKPVAIEKQIIPNAFEVESLLSEICDTVTIAEFELKLGGFRLYVTRNLAGKNKPSAQISPVSANVIVHAPDSNGSVSAHSLAISKPTPSGEIRTLLEKATDEGLVMIKSPRVGFFRRSRTIKGKRAPPPCKENQIVKEGQVICYIEQLGGEIPLESDVAGEVVKILKKDGEPVGYGDALMEILPSFPGIKKLQ